MELSSIKYSLSDLKALCEGNASKNSVDFFDSSFTYFNESIEVPCCSPNATLTDVTCGQGTSCVGQCSAIGASLCLSGNCTEDPEDCNLILDSTDTRKRSSMATLSSDKLKHCYPACKVKHIPGCCFHASCYAIRPKLCSKMNYFSSNSFSVLSCCIIFFSTANSCPKPGSIPNGAWSCQTQELPIPDATFLDNGANTFPGKSLDNINDILQPLSM